MRKPRIIIFDDNAAIVMALEDFFINRGYEVVSYTEPLVCPIYEKDGNCCDKSLPCADIVITDLHMPRMTGPDLLRRQAERGCKLVTGNKAVMSSYVAGAYEDIIKDLGCSFFYKPLIMSSIPDWLTEREKHFDLSKPLNALKKQDDH